MVTDIMAKSLLEEFNEFFKGSAEIKTSDGRLEITVGSQTLIVSLPEIIGGDSMGQSQQS